MRTTRCWPGPSPPDRRPLTVRRRPAAGCRGPPRAPARCAPWPRHRPARLPAARPAVRVPGAEREPADGDPFDLRPVDEARAGPPSRRAGRRRSPRRRARIRSGSRPARRGRRATTAGDRRRRIGRRSPNGRRDRSSGRHRQLDPLDVGERRAEQAPREGVERGRVTGRQLDVARRPGRRPRRPPRAR